MKIFEGLENFRRGYSSDTIEKHLFIGLTYISRPHSKIARIWLNNSTKCNDKTGNENCFWQYSMFSWE